MSKYQTVLVIHHSVEIWDNLTMWVEKNDTGYRVHYHEVEWRNNTGSLKSRVARLSLVEGDRMMAAYHAAEVEMNSDEPHGYTPYQVITQQLQSNYA